MVHSKTYGFGDAMITAACKDLGLSSVKDYRDLILYVDYRSCTQERTYRGGRLCHGYVAASNERRIEEQRFE